jgi:hypothetical protein
LERSISLNPNWDSPYWVLVATYSQLDRMDDARAALAKFLQLLPAATVPMLRRSLPIRNQERLEMVLLSLKRVGLPD